MNILLDDNARHILANPEKRHAWAMYQLKLKGLSMASLARTAGVNRITMYAVWQKRYPRMESIIAHALDMRPQDLFPDRYDEQGEPLKWLGGKTPPTLKPDAKNTTRKKRRNGSSKTKNDHESELQAA